MAALGTLQSQCISPFPCMCCRWASTRRASGRLVRRAHNQVDWNHRTAAVQPLLSARACGVKSKLGSAVGICTCSQPAAVWRLCMCARCNPHMHVCSTLTCNAMGTLTHSVLLYPGCRALQPPSTRRCSVTRASHDCGGLLGVCPWRCQSSAPTQLRRTQTCSRLASPTHCVNTFSRAWESCQHGLD